VFGYVDGTIKMPAKEIPHSDGTMQSNPAWNSRQSSSQLY
jgi:hypothetical protein